MVSGLIINAAFIIPKYMKKSCPGFTLIELLVVISIIGILFTIGIAAYSEFNRGQILSQAAKNFKNDLRQAQSKALSGEKPAGCTIALTGYQVTFTANSYTLNALCPNTVLVKTTSLPQNVTFSGSPGNILFKVLTQGVEGAQTITLTAFSKTKQVAITAVGEIN